MGITIHGSYVRTAIVMYVGLGSSERRTSSAVSQLCSRHRYRLFVCTCVAVIGTQLAAFLTIIPVTNVYDNSLVQPTITTNTTRPITVAYALSLIKCGDHQSNVPGMLDAAAVLAHSVHTHSVRTGQSKYDYKLYAFVHTDAQRCSQGLADLGFEILVRDTPFALADIQDETLRKIMPKAWCCGEKEFVKLYAYLLFQKPLVVHMDVDFLLTKPMDDLFNVMLLGGSSARLPREQYSFLNNASYWPVDIQAAMTRDWGQARPGRKPGFQAGFLVIKPSQKAFDEIVETIKTTHYVTGYSRDAGWGGRGYGVFVGAAAMQGLLAYYYDIISPNNWIELNQCRFNHMGMDVYFRGKPNFSRRPVSNVGKCRNNQSMNCEDCQNTPLKAIYSIHYTQCRKPWSCVGEGTTTRPKRDKLAIPEDNVVLDHCMELQTRWHDYRTDLENKLFQLTGNATVNNARRGQYKREVFQGHCTDYGGNNYLPIAQGDAWLVKRISDIYKA
jgi:hypothetical protein